MNEGNERNYEAPAFNKKAYNCPHCNAYAHQEWGQLFYRDTVDQRVSSEDTSDMDQSYKHGRQNDRNTSLKDAFSKVDIYETYHEVYISTCARCKKYSIWHGENRNAKMLYPKFKGISPPNPDLSDDIKRDYNEATLIMQESPRGAAALLRIALEKLCQQLGDKKKSLNSNIQKVVEKIPDERIHKALDLVRVIGNEAVHPGQIDLKDDIEIVRKLFWLLNFIASEMISKEKEINAFFEEKIPEKQKEQIKKKGCSKETIEL